MEFDVPDTAGRVSETYEMRARSEARAERYRDLTERLGRDETDGYAETEFGDNENARRERGRQVTMEDLDENYESGADAEGSDVESRAGGDRLTDPAPSGQAGEESTQETESTHRRILNKAKDVIRRLYEKYKAEAAPIEEINLEDLEDTTATTSSEPYEDLGSPRDVLHNLTEPTSTSVEDRPLYDNIRQAIENLTDSKGKITQLKRLSILRALAKYYDVPLSSELLLELTKSLDVSLQGKDWVVSHGGADPFMQIKYNAPGTADGVIIGDPPILEKLPPKLAKAAGLDPKDQDWRNVSEKLAKLRSKINFLLKYSAELKADLSSKFMEKARLIKEYFNKKMSAHVTGPHPFETNMNLY